MAMVRRIQLGFQAANKSIKEVEEIVPAEWIPEDSYAEAIEVLQFPEVKRRISVTGQPLWVRVSAPYDNSPAAFRLQ